jgi:Cdc6-like AAA superfamily ATPase
VVSPFIFNNPVNGENFFDRENVLEDMLNYLFRRRDRGNIWLLGQRQSGKTSILKHLETEFNKIKHKTNKGQLVKFIYFDCQAVSNKALLFDEIASKIGLNLDLSHKSTIRVASDYFTSVFKQILEKNYYIILLLDEFDALLDYHGNRDERIKAENVVKDIRVRINGIPKLPRQPKLISAVFASDRRYKDLASHFKIGSPLNYFEIELEWFDDTQIEKLIQQYLPNDYSIFNHNDIHLCFQLSQGHPKLVQKVLDLIYCQKMAGKMDKKVIKEDTKEFIQKTPTVICNLKVPGYIKTRLNEIGVKVGNVDSIFMSNKEDYDE